MSFDAAKVLRELPEVTGIMKGEGEETFAQLAGYYVDKRCEKRVGGGKRLPERQAGLKDIPAFLSPPDGSLADTGVRQAMDMSRIPFPYKNMDIKDLEHRIIYYESSRGCPFSCSYCLSSIDKSVRFRSLELVLDELAYFLAAGVSQVKFVDRTFNCNKNMPWPFGSLYKVRTTESLIFILRLPLICWTRRKWSFWARCVPDWSSWRLASSPPIRTRLRPYAARLT